MLLSIADRDKAEAEPIIRALGDAGYRLYATAGTAALVRRLGYDVTAVGKLTDGDQAIINLIRAGRANLVVNTVTGGRPALQDGFEIRRAAAEHQVPCLTSLDTVGALLESMTGGSDEYSVRSLPAYRTGATVPPPAVGASDVPAAVVTRARSLSPAKSKAAATGSFRDNRRTGLYPRIPGSRAAVRVP